jgi:NADPH:quinone reductase-like Zn-dependent oxidoreductase
MQAAQANSYGDIAKAQKMIHVVTDAKIPTLLSDIQDPNDRKNWAVIRVTAVALAPGDVRVLSGRTAKFQAPPSFPYILGGDVCGEVVEIHPYNKHPPLSNRRCDCVTVLQEHAHGWTRRICIGQCRTQAGLC